jgi:septal ring factor EnvC (AmiA/AmiB activator)
MMTADWVALLVPLIGVVVLVAEWFRSSSQDRGDRSRQHRFVLLVGIAALVVQYANERLTQWEHRREQEQFLATLQATQREQERLLATLEMTRLEQAEHRREQDKLVAAVKSLEAQGRLTREEARALMRPAAPTEARVSLAPPAAPPAPPTEVPGAPVRILEASSALPVPPAAPTGLTVR